MTSPAKQKQNQQVRLYIDFVALLIFRSIQLRFRSEFALIIKVLFSLADFLITKSGTILIILNKRKKMKFKKFLICTSIYIFSNFSQADVLMNSDDYGPVLDERDWLESRNPGLTCNMPKLNQVSVALCPKCIVMDVRPHMSDSTLMIIDLASNETLEKLVSFYENTSIFVRYPNYNYSDKVYFVLSDNKDLNTMAFLGSLFNMQNIMISDSKTITDHERHIILSLQKATNFKCEFDEDM